MALEPERPERSLAAVLGDIAGNVQQIVRAEIRLAKAEIRDELRPVRRAVVLLAGGALVSVLAVGVLLLAAVYALATTMPQWAAALIVGGVAALAGVVCIVSGARQVKNVKLPPPRTAATVQETVQWAKARVR